MKETMEFIPDEKRKEKIRILIEEGYRWKCLGCGGVYKDRPEQMYEDGHGGRYIDMCQCGSDLFIELKDISCENVEVGPVGGTIVLKEHNFKYCKCDKGEVWTGDAETECGAEGGFRLLEKSAGKKVFLCPKSGLKIICLKSTEEELKNAGYLRLPG